MLVLSYSFIHYFQFIQPQDSEKEVVRFFIPASAMLHQFVLGHYLRQNLLQFLTVPKYYDAKQVGVFRDYTYEQAPAIPNSDVFLYNRGWKKEGGKGEINSFYKKHFSTYDLF